MKKQTRLYNVIFPIWMLFLFPQFWWVALPANLLIDCGVILLVLTAMKHNRKKPVLKKIWWKVWILGFVADFAGVAALMPAALIGTKLPGDRYLWWATHIEPIMYNCWRSPYATAIVAAAVALAGVCIYFLDRWALRSCTLLSTHQQKIMALTLAIVTAPWMFFIPTY